MIRPSSITYCAALSRRGFLGVGGVEGGSYFSTHHKVRDVGGFLCDVLLRLSLRQLLRLSHRVRPTKNIIRSIYIKKIHTVCSTGSGLTTPHSLKKEQQQERQRAAEHTTTTQTKKQQPPRQRRRRCSTQHDAKRRNVLSAQQGTQQNSLNCCPEKRLR